MCQNTPLNLLGSPFCPSHRSFSLSSTFDTWATWRGCATARDSGEKSKRVTSDGSHLAASPSTAESKVMSGFICCLIKKSRTGPTCDSQSGVAWVLILIEFSGLWSCKRSEMCRDFYGPLLADRPVPGESLLCGGGRFSFSWCPRCQVCEAQPPEPNKTMLNHANETLN